MIQEVIVSTHNQHGKVHLAPMGVHIIDPYIVILPFKPSTTLENILLNKTAAINYCDDVRIFAGCLTGRRDWATENCQKIGEQRLSNSLAHVELQLERIEDDSTRPKLFCTPLVTINHAPFQGFNRAQHSVIEAAILVSRLHMLPWEKIQQELNYLQIGLDKTAGEREQEAWQWLMNAIEGFKSQQEAAQ